MPTLDLIETKSLNWLLVDFAPETYSREQLDELDLLTEEREAGHECHRATARPGRTPDS